MKCLLHGEVSSREVVKIEEMFFVCGRPNEGNIYDLEYDGRMYQIKDICGQVLNDGTNSFYHNIDNVSGMGDCIQLTAFFTYIKRKFDNAEIFHKITGMRRDCAQIDPRRYYPKDLVIFVT